MADIVQQLRADAIHSEIRTGNPKETRLSWVAADEIDRLRGVLLKIEQETIDYVAVRAARGALAPVSPPLTPKDGTHG